MEASDIECTKQEINWKKLKKLREEFCLRPFSNTKSLVLNYSNNSKISHCV